ncbi:MAG: DoxX family protein [Deferribacterales bacterium]
MIRKIFETKDSYAALVARLTLGIVILPHGLQKVFGWFGGFGFEGTMGFFTQQMGIPYIFALLAVLAESLGAAAVIAGLFTRLAAIGVGVTVGIGALMVHLPNGFFMNWFGTQQGEGYEYHILAVGLALAVAISGGGKFALDKLVAEKLNK